MPDTYSIKIIQLESKDISHFESMMTVFGEAFEDIARYCDKRPSKMYVEALLNSDYFIALAALERDRVVAGLAAYELKKFERECSEIYIYDLAVADTHRRQGIATALIQKLRRMGSDRKADVIFVQADYEDPPAIALYESLGVREEVLHFDIAISDNRSICPQEQ